MATPLSRKPGAKDRALHGSAFVPVTKSSSQRAVPVCTQQLPWGWPFFFSRLVSKNDVFGISRCKLLYIGWINNKVLLTVHRELYSVSMINCNRKEYEKEYIYKLKKNIYIKNIYKYIYIEIKHNIVNQLYFNKIKK